MNRAVFGGVHGFSGACVVFWGGMHGFFGGVPGFLGGCMVFWAGMRRIRQDTVNERAVRNLLECILVS